MILNICLDVVAVEDAQNFPELGFCGIIIDSRFAVVRVNVDVQHARQSEQFFFDGRRALVSVTFRRELQSSIAATRAATAFFAHFKHLAENFRLVKVSFVV